MEGCWEASCEILPLGNWRGRGTHQVSNSTGITLNQFSVNEGILARTRCSHKVSDVSDGFTPRR